MRVFASGVLGVAPSLPNGSLTAIEVDSTGRLWALDVTQIPGVPPAFYRLAAGGSSISLALNVLGAQAFDVDACDRLHVLVASSAAAAQIEVRDGETGAVIATTPVTGTLPSVGAIGIGDAIDFVLDVDGSYWIKLGGFVDHVSATGMVLGNYFDCAGGGTSSKQNAGGDATGYHLATIIDPFGDIDFDGSLNRREVVLGSDPFDPNVTPTTLSVISPPTPGTNLVLAATIPSEAGFPYLFGLSFGQGGIPVPGAECREIPLQLDPLLFAWVDLITNSGFPPTAAGLLDASGSTNLIIPIPATPLGSVPLSFCLITAEPSGGSFSTISDTAAFLVP